MLKIRMIIYKLLTKNMYSKRSDYFNKKLYIQHDFRTQLANSYSLAFKILR